jgi:hypothetical protein
LHEGGNIVSTVKHRLNGNNFKFFLVLARGNQGQTFFVSHPEFYYIQQTLGLDRIRREAVKNFQRGGGLLKCPPTAFNDPYPP